MSDVKKLAKLESYLRTIQAVADRDEVTISAIILRLTLSSRRSCSS